MSEFKVVRNTRKKGDSILSRVTFPSTNSQSEMLKVIRESFERGHTEIDANATLREAADMIIEAWKQEVNAKAG